jgi:hypothetical protein
MQTLVKLSKNETSFEVQSCIQNLEHELIDFVNVQAPADAKKYNRLPQPYYKIQVLDFVSANVQRHIDLIKRIQLVVPDIFNSKEIELVTQKKIAEIDQQINEYHHARTALSREKSLVVLDPLKKKYGKYFFIIAFVVGGSDAMLAFMNFIDGAYPILLALFASISLGMVISVSHIGYSPWIRHAKSSRTKMVRIVTVLLLAFALFAWLGNLRAAASNSAVNIDLSNQEVFTPTPTHLNGWAISIVSFVLFVGIFSISLVLWKDKNERLQERKYQKLKNEIDTISTRVETLEKAREGLVNNVITHKGEARTKFDQLKTSIALCKSTGICAVIRYRQLFSRANQNIPPFFNEPINFQYDETIQIFQSPKTENI